MCNGTPFAIEKFPASEASLKHVTARSFTDRVTGDPLKIFDCSQKFLEKKTEIRKNEKKNEKKNEEKVCFVSVFVILIANMCCFTCTF